MDHALVLEKMNINPRGVLLLLMIQFIAILIYGSFRINEAKKERRAQIEMETRASLGFPEHEH